MLQDGPFDAQKNWEWASSKHEYMGEVIDLEFQQEINFGQKHVTRSSYLPMVIIECTTVVINP